MKDQEWISYEKTTELKVCLEPALSLPWTPYVTLCHSIIYDCSLSLFWSVAPALVWPALVSESVCSRIRTHQTMKLGTCCAGRFHTVQEPHNDWQALLNKPQNQLTYRNLRSLSAGNARSLLTRSQLRMPVTKESYEVRNLCSAIAMAVLDDDNKLSNFWTAKHQLCVNSQRQRHEPRD